LVNQVTNYAQVRDYMAPFRPFLSPRYAFLWTEQLDEAFKKSKAAIIDLIKNGVEIFDLTRTTCLRPDYSKRGIGYFLLQKHCECISDIPECCTNGWRISMAGSRFLTPAEQRYAPIEGEALAVSWGLEQTKYFTLGCANLKVVTDHKPLVKIFGDKTLDEIANIRLFRLKQRTLPWSFDIYHLPGKTNHAADAASRHPSPEGETFQLSHADKSESILAAAIRRDTETLTSITWQRLQTETRNDPEMAELLQAVHQGFPGNSRHLGSVAPFWQYRHAVYESFGVLLYDDRVIVPPSLRQTALEALHSAHQGTTTMSNRAKSIMFWPGMTEDIKRIRAACRDCNHNAPSQAPLPSTPATPPSTPFEEIFADYFDCAGRHYLVIGDRLSGWSDVFQSPHGSPQAGADGLITCLRNYFSRFGVPNEMVELRLL